MTNHEFIIRVLKVTSEHDLQGELLWRVENNEAKFDLICNDWFAWASADCVEITPENIDLLDSTMKEAVEVDPLGGRMYGGGLFCCRVEKMLPQPPWFNADRLGKYPKLAELIRAVKP